MKTWNQKPSKKEVLEAVYLFFELLSSGKDEEARKMVQCTGSWEELLRGLYEDIEEWHEDFEDPSFEGDWLNNLTPPAEVTSKDLLAVCWTYHEDDTEYNQEYIAEEGENVLINVFFLDEPTDVTGEFSVATSESGYILELVNIHVM